MAQAINEQDLAAPWSVDTEDERRFKRLLLLLLLLYLLLGVIVPFIRLMEEEEPPKPVEPPPLLTVEIEVEELPPPVKIPEPVVEAPKVTQKPTPVPPRKVETPPPPVKPTPVEAPPGPKINKEVLALAALKDEMADMRDSFSSSNMGKTGSSSGKTAGKTERALISSNKAGNTSGGINAAEFSHDARGGSGGGEGRTSTRVSTNLKGGGGGGSGSGTGRSSAGSAGRSEESIRKVMDRNKGKMYAVYNRSLRSNPTLRGKFTVRLVIEPSGVVSSIKLVSSELKDPALEKKLLARVKGINFGPEDVARTTLNYSFDFLPS